MITARFETITPRHLQFEKWANAFVTAGRRHWGRDTTAYPPAELAQLWDSTTYGRGLAGGDRRRRSRGRRRGSRPVGVLVEWQKVLGA